MFDQVSHTQFSKHPHYSRKTKSFFLPHVRVIPITYGPPKIMIHCESRQLDFYWRQNQTKHFVCAQINFFVWQLCIIDIAFCQTFCFVLAGLNELSGELVEVIKNVTLPLVDQVFPAFS